MCLIFHASIDRINYVPHIFYEGELYAWGCDEGDGQLGLGPSRGPDQAGGLSIPSRVKALPLSVAVVSCG